MWLALQLSKSRQGPTSLMLNKATRGLLQVSTTNSNSTRLSLKLSVKLARKSDHPVSLTKKLGLVRTILWHRDLVSIRCQTPAKCSNQKMELHLIRVELWGNWVILSEENTIRALVSMIWLASMQLERPHSREAVHPTTSLFATKIWTQPSERSKQKSRPELLQPFQTVSQI